uniref:Uncharacterized protein n=1 Tax=Anguilla anguilla TaxID=7936 RepID=A0A0E9R874_ANGAN
MKMLASEECLYSLSERTVPSHSPLHKDNVKEHCYFLCLQFDCKCEKCESASVPLIHRSNLLHQSPGWSSVSLWPNFQ